MRNLVVQPETFAEAEGPLRPLELPVLAAMAPNELTVKVLTTAAELREVLGQWQRLSDGALEANPFFEPAMVLPLLERLGAEVSAPEFVTLTAPHPSKKKGATVLCGLFPIVRTRAGGVNVWQLWKHPYRYLGAPLLLSAAARPTLAAFFDWMASSGRLRLGALRFDDLASDGPFRGVLVDELQARHWPSLVVDAYHRALYRPAASAQAFIEASLSHKRRKDLGRQKNRLQSAGSLKVTSLQSEDELRKWIDAFVELESRGWKGKDGVALASHERHREFFTAMCREAWARGRLMMLALELNGRPIAMKLNLMSGEGGFAFKITYDEAFARDSPGVLLELENLELLHARSAVRWVDSCAAPNRFMINHLWHDRREIQTVLVGSDDASSGLALALMPLARWIIARVRKLRAASKPESKQGTTEQP